LIAAGNVSIEMAMLEGVEGLTKLLSHVPLERVLFGSYFPFFAWEAAELKLRESALAEKQREAIRRQSAQQLLAARL
jgi:predicted TIM-barrel fold metal-dependent hydrolase